MSLRHRRRRSLFFGGSDAYAVASFSPALVFDFASEFYRTGRATSTFDDSLTYTGTSAKTMVDSDGLVKWAPHNYVKYSEDFDNAAWVKTGVTVASGIADPDGGSTAWSLTQDETTGYHRVAMPIAPSRSPDQIYTAYLKSNGSQFVQLFYGYGAATLNYCTFDLINGVTGTPGGSGLPTASIADVGSGWYKCSLGDLNTVGSTTVWVILGEAIDDLSLNNSQPQFTGDGSSGAFIWHPHAYRSDLGGMVDNPDRSDSYVPTTSAAVYLPRRGHHIYNGSSWVNEGLLLESEARTNLDPTSDTFTATGNVTLTVDQAVSPSGETDGVLLDENTASSGNSTLLHGSAITTVATTTYTASVYVKAVAGNSILMMFHRSNSGSNQFISWFNISEGTFLSTSTPAGTMAYVTSAIENVGNGWFRISTTGTDSTQVSYNPVVTLVTADGSFTRDTDAMCYLWGAQFEAGFTPSSYIPTAGATVTRAAETLTVAAADLPYSAVNMSMQMDGEVSYAETGTSGGSSGRSGDAVFYTWWIDGANFIEAYLATAAANDYMTAAQEASSVRDIATEIYPAAPGVNTNYNLASRYGSTFVNIARNGTTATVNETPTALADLSAIDLNLAYTYMGTIGKFRMWDEDLGDTGITSASARTYTTEFAMIVETTTASETFTIPCQNSGTFNATIDWGDNSDHSTITAYNDADLAHVYNSPGEHVIRITGTFPNIYFNNAGDKAKVISVENLGEVGWTRLNRAFYGCSNMTSFTSGTTDTSAVIYMDIMFRGCSSLTSLDVSGFNTALVTSMSYMFRDCSSLTSLDVTNFNTALATSMSYMFYNCSSLTSLDVSGFNTASVTTTGYMFHSCSGLTSLDLSSFNTALVISMSYMFHSCSGLTSLDLSSFNTALVTTMSNMFRGCSSLTSLDLSSSNTALVTNMNAMFYGCSSLTSLDVTNFNTALVTNMGSMFYNCTSLTDIIGVDTFDIGGLNSTADLTNFALNVTLPTARYDALLLAWEAQDPFDGMSPNFGSSTYTGGGAVATAHASLISRDGWTITDGGVA